MCAGLRAHPEGLDPSLPRLACPWMLGREGWGVRGRGAGGGAPTFMPGTMRRKRNTMSMFARRTMSHSDSSPCTAGFLEGHGEGSGEARDARGRRSARTTCRERRG